MTKSELKEILAYEFSLYFPNKKMYWKCRLQREHEYEIWRFQTLLRKEEYLKSHNSKILRFLVMRKRNRLGARLGFFIPTGVFGKGLHIWHYGGIVVNHNVKAGTDCILHGDNCIGNDGGSENMAPQIGNHVDIGVGAKIIGNVIIADDVKIGAGAVVVKSVPSVGATAVGVPARMIFRE